MSKTQTSTTPIVSTEPRFTIYTIPRKFRDGAKLHPFLARKTPDLISLNSNQYTLFTVLSALRQVISSERLFDPNNTTVIVCSPDLEAALNLKSLHVTEVRDHVILQMDVASEDLLASLAPPQPPTIVGAGNQGQQPFDTEGQYWVKPHFLKVLRMVKDVPSNKVVFSYREVTSYLSQYILERQSKFFDQRNIRVAHVNDDPLGVAFGVKVFHRTQVTALLRKQLIPFKPKDDKILLQNRPDQNSAPKILRFASLPSMNELNIGHVTTHANLTTANNKTTEQSLDMLSNASSRKRAYEISENSESKDDQKEDTISPPSRRIRRRSSTTRTSITVTVVKDNRESDDETIHSAQGYETNVLEDDVEMSDHEYDVYDIEYTPESDGDEAEAPKNYSDSSDGESEFEATVVVEQFELLKTDDSYDEEADESSEDGSDNDFEGFDPELNGDMWKCLECKQPNTPYIRYCSACYKERKGWLPERPKPKKKKPVTGDNNSKSPLKRLKKSKLSPEDVSSDSKGSQGKRNPEDVSAMLIGTTSLILGLSERGSSAPSSSQDSGFSELTQSTEAESQSIESDESDVENEITAQKAGRSKNLGKLEKDMLKKGFSISSSNPSMLCTLCCSQPKNACLVHGKISHQVCCYGCAKKLYKKRLPCPVCRRRVEKITKNIIA